MAFSLWWLNMENFATAWNALLETCLQTDAKDTYDEPGL